MNGKEGLLERGSWCGMNLMVGIWSGVKPERVEGSLFMGVAAGTVTEVSSGETTAWDRLLLGRSGGDAGDDGLRRPTGPDCMLLVRCRAMFFGLSLAFTPEAGDLLGGETTEVAVTTLASAPVGK